MLQPPGHRRLQGRCGGEGQELVGLGDGGQQGWGGHHPAHLPAGQGEDLARRAHLGAAPAHTRQAHQRDMGAVIIGQVFIDLVADGIGVVVFQQLGDEGQFVGVEHLAARIGRAVQHQHLGLGAEGIGQGLARQRPIRRLQADDARHAAGPADDRQIGIVKRLDHHHLVAGLDQAEQTGGQRLGGARGHHHLGFVHPGGPKAVFMRRHRLTQRDDTHHRRILMRPVDHRLGQALDHRRRLQPLGKTLPQIDGAMVLRQARHGFKDGGAAGGEDRIGAGHGGNLGCCTGGGTLTSSVRGSMPNKCA